MLGKFRWRLAFIPYCTEAFSKCCRDERVPHLWLRRLLSYSGSFAVAQTKKPGVGLFRNRCILPVSPGLMVIIIRPVYVKD
ncbi:hypothetical protein BU26DRAFT_184595 [Trematosphaeria pertusa]|uniref:Uncharacterized protein n=1 Tax=Trematosphaeria pertusa TaxID=390896 RepID=A0A6A6HTS4_9PLEO|nr:uncharacterized protein BU26DRAFT_184595 [Trematosphaeria pertusa]KAF2240933.1 hypothetical protein BU26DRAFT_184595 [Trematosphaeria pertusa]